MLDTVRNRSKIIEKLKQNKQQTDFIYDLDFHCSKNLGKRLRKKSCQDHHEGISIMGDEQQYDNAQVKRKKMNEDKSYSKDIIMEQSESSSLMALGGMEPG